MYANTRRRARRRDRTARLNRTSAALALAGAVAFAACHVPLRAHGAPAPRASPATPVAADRSWSDTLDVVRAALLRGDRARVESALDHYVRDSTNLTRAKEALFWRALARLDLARGVGTMRDAIADLDAYRGGGDSLPHAAEASTLRRVVGQLDSVRAALAYERSAFATMQAGYVPRDSLRARDEELQRARTELERIRRRLAAPAVRP